MFDRIAQWQPDQGAAATARAVTALALAASGVPTVVRTVDRADQALTA